MIREHPQAAFEILNGISWPVADFVEAMSSHRPYRPALGTDAELEEIEKHKGETCDATVADACIAVFREERFEFPE